MLAVHGDDVAHVWALFTVDYVGAPVAIHSDFEDLAAVDTLNSVNLLNLQLIPGSPPLLLLVPQVVLVHLAAPFYVKEGQKQPPGKD